MLSDSGAARLQVHAGYHCMRCQTHIGVHLGTTWCLIEHLVKQSINQSINYGKREKTTDQEGQYAGLGTDCGRHHARPGEEVAADEVGTNSGLRTAAATSVPTNKV